MKAPPCEDCPPEFFSRENCLPGKITPNRIPYPLINHTNERKNKITKCFALKKVVQHNILMKIAKVLFDTQMISQKILSLQNEKNPKLQRKRKRQMAFTCQLYKSRRTKIRQSNYKIWQIWETIK